MKKLLFSAVALAMLATASCKKDDDDDASGPSNSVTAAGQVYAVTGFNSNGRNVTITGGSGSDNVIFTMRFGTGTATPSAGTYNIVEDADEADEVEIGVLRAVNSTVTGYDSQDGSANATVTMDGDKMKISFPSITVLPRTGLGSENISISANATQL